jgi:Fe-S oxidoreductase
VTATWDDAPHLGEKEKAELMAALPPYQRDARSKGVPQLGSGAVYPVQEVDLVVEPFAIPSHFKMCYGLDVGWNNTAAVWLAHDVDGDVVYVTHDYKRGQGEPAVHAAAIKARGDYIGVIDPASRGRAQKDGEQLIELYKQQGIDVRVADNTVEAGIFDVYERMTTGRLKVFKTCTETLSELRIYRRDEKGRIVKQNDHCMDALRYAVRSGLSMAGYAKPQKKDDPFARTGPRGGWMSV